MRSVDQRYKLPTAVKYLAQVGDLIDKFLSTKESTKTHAYPNR